MSERKQIIYTCPECGHSFFSLKKYDLSVLRCPVCKGLVNECIVNKSLSDDSIKVDTVKGNNVDVLDLEPKETLIKYYCDCCGYYILMKPELDEPRIRKCPKCDELLFRKKE